MLNKILQKLRQFFIEKPSARGNWQWVINNADNSALETKKGESCDDSPQIYLPYQMNYFIQPSKSANSSYSQTDHLIHLSNCLAKAYYPDAQAVKFPNQEKAK